MKQLFWRVVAALITLPWITNALVRFAQLTPHNHLGERGDDGDDYMGRWWLMRGRPSKEACPWWMAWNPIAIRLHHIKRPDNDNHLHDHPFDFRSIVLRGFYTEQDVLGHFHLRGEGDTYISPAERFHRIHLVSNGGVWTLFIMFPMKQLWGFLVGGRKIKSATYLDPVVGKPYRDQCNADVIMDREMLTDWIMVRNALSFARSMQSCQPLGKPCVYDGPLEIARLRAEGRTRPLPTEVTGDRL